jgi:hypothetical protein
MKPTERSRRRNFFNRAVREFRIEQKRRDKAWKALEYRLDAEYPGWREDKLLAQRVKLVFEEEFEAAKHKGIVRVRSLLEGVHGST